MSRRYSRRRVVAGIGALATSISVAGCSGDSGESNGDNDNSGPVEMTDDLSFEPAEVTVTAGDTVVWENVGSIGHSVTAYEDQIPEDAKYFASGGFSSEQAARSGYSQGDPESGSIPQGESYEYTFEVPGTYEYFCIPHESTMVGTITVE